MVFPLTIRWNRVVAANDIAGEINAGGKVLRDENTVFSRALLDQEEAAPLRIAAYFFDCQPRR